MLLPKGKRRSERPKRKFYRQIYEIFLEKDQPIVLFIIKPHKILNYHFLIGGNLGNRVQYLAKARQEISEKIGEILSISKLYETAAWGYTEQPAFLNQALFLKSDLLPSEVLEKINEIERNLGRERNQKWYARTLDIDIIFCEQQIIDLPHLSIPHPHISERRFVLVPLAEIAATFLHPILKLNVQELLENCPDHLEVKPYETPTHLQ